ncbi:Calpain-A [Portunus trituberculatus]|uniref:Calpain-A n=1 Tax=Portunus trituberculatus TaxID=210409 RepID=A0A5B7FQQ8_PORTR|nr:Calpain-A [Portunus trituberculatus]
MIAMMDVDRSGKLGLQEFLQLWMDIRVWKNAFKLYDKDNSGQLCSFELRQALNSAGYRLNHHISDALMLRYGDRDGKVSFDDFIMCSVKLKTMMGKYITMFVTLRSTHVAASIHSLDMTLPPLTGLQDDPDKMQEFYDELMSEQQENPEEEEEQEDEE